MLELNLVGDMALCICSDLSIGQAIKQNNDPAGAVYAVINLLTSKIEYKYASQILLSV
jgi:hypothetical protein